MKPQAYELLADVFDYPGSELPASVNQLVALLPEYSPEAVAALAAFQSVFQSAGFFRSQDVYIRTLRSRASCSLDAAYFLSGESGPRGLFLAGRAARSRGRKLPATIEMPDHMSCLL